MRLTRARARAHTLATTHAPPSRGAAPNRLFLTRTPRAPPPPPRSLFTACLHLGASVEEYDAARDAVVTVFRRDDEWRDALAAILKKLRKYYKHDALPARVALAKWRVLRERLLPMLTLYHKDR